MPTLTQEDVCTFDELSDSAKETARDWMRDCEIEDFGQDTESLYYSALAAAKILGIEFDDKGKRVSLIFAGLALVRKGMERPL